MNIDLISSIARCHREDVLRRAALERKARRPRGGRSSLRRGLARAARSVGNIFLNLGDALAEKAR
jgi:hypothetical protein